MKRVFGLVGYACNGKSTIIKKIMNNKDYYFVDLPQIYKYEASKNGFSGVTEWYTSVGLSKFEKESKKAVLDYIDKELPRTKNLIIDDIFDKDIYNKLIKIFPHMKLISFHSKYSDRLKRLQVRTGLKTQDLLEKGLAARDNMKRFCGIEEIFPHCKFEITNTKSIETAKKLFESEIKKPLIICIVGYSGTGKSTIVDYIQKYLNVQVFEYGKEVTSIMNSYGFSKSRDFINNKSLEEYITITEKEIKNRLKKFMKINKFFIIDGIVSSEIYDSLTRKNDVCSIYLKLNKEDRIKRIQKRENLTSKNAKENLDIKDDIKVACGLDIIVSKCSHVINNDKQITSTVNSIIKIIENYNK